MNITNLTQSVTRREALAATGALIGGLTLSGHAAAQQAPSARVPPTLVHVVDLHIEVQPALAIGRTPAGTRSIVRVSGGTFEGPGLRGIVLPGGTDAILGRPDGATQLDVRVTLQTDDDQLIYTRYDGLMDTNPAAVPTAAGESTVEGMYWRVTPTFETGSERYAWMNRIVCVGVGDSTGGRANYTVYAVR